MDEVEAFLEVVVLFRGFWNRKFLHGYLLVHLNGNL